MHQRNIYDHNFDLVNTPLINENKKQICQNKGG